MIDSRELAKEVLEITSKDLTSTTKKEKINAAIFSILNRLVKSKEIDNSDRSEWIRLIKMNISEIEKEYLKKEELEEIKKSLHIKEARWAEINEEKRINKTEKEKLRVYPEYSDNPDGNHKIK